MPPVTALRRVSTLVVGALFAVVFVCSGVSTAQPAAPHTESVVGAHTSTSKVVVRAATHTAKVAPAPLDLASTGPASSESYEPTDAPVEVAIPLVTATPATFTASERAPPAL